MNAEIVRALVDQLVARDGVYRPLELLKLVRRLDARDEQCWRRGEIGLLENSLYGDPQCSAELLRVAAEWARRLELVGERDDSGEGEGRRIFRRGTDDELARTHWCRSRTSQQGDLFMDNARGTARNRLQRALIAGDRERAERHLAEMAREHAGDQALTDAEHLVGALLWLDQPGDTEARTRAMEEELVPRARRLLGSADANGYLARLWRGLAGQVDAEKLPGMASALYERAGDWDRVLAILDGKPEALNDADLLARTARAGLAGNRRETAWKALAALCWQAPEAAEAFFEHSRDAEVQRRIEAFWDLEPPLTIELFPAWLLTQSFALPPLHEDDSRGSQALALVRGIKSRPGAQAPRKRLAEHEPGLMRHWLAARGD
ncbi:hypothetical protein IC757_09995 [Wenzhouxiangella sp. AB-CW3]|uniref:hypothetical protein n=1 Tax=Wenzhouxiangella sp. AB-CW3 TaxID=2771012 RepID=UPI00168C0D08|nr:hypothetical protein [Wenzhouxiangella sp. AB-CW3]QOC21386.1 hypothetical protein IC757_09995 [Wenzhouxiangella sp. AB-CW3]